MNPTVYLETTIIGYLAMQPSGVLRIAANQQTTHESNEPAHVHIDRDQASCKFWLSPVSLAGNLGFRAPELRDIERLIEDHVDDLLKEWEAVHGEPG